MSTPRMDLALRKAQEDCTESYLLTEGLKLERELNEANKTNRLQYELITTAEKRGVDKSKEELSVANECIKRLEREVELLRLYGNKDCTVMADEALAKEAKP